MDRLRGPGGCPWDHEQTYASLRRFLLEECYEVADAIDRNDLDALREELGDLMLQIVFLSRIAKEQGAFTVDDVAHGISDKLVRRHPHVFGAGSAETPAEVERSWEAIKQREKAERGHRPGSALDGIPPALPALLKARMLGDKAARIGFDWPGSAEVLDKLDEERRELGQALDSGDADGVRAELGDALFTLVMLARKCGTDPEAALEQTNREFRRRFQWIERELERRGLASEDAGSELLEGLWEEAKRADDG